MKKWLRNLFNRECSGAGKHVATPQIREVDWHAEEATYTGHCPECGKFRACTGRGEMLPHRG